MTVESLSSFLMPPTLITTFHQIHRKEEKDMNEQLMPDPVMKVFN